MRIRKTVKKIGQYTLVLFVADAAIICTALYIADATGKPALYYDGRMPGFFGRLDEAFKDYVGELDLKHLFTTDLGHLFKKIGYKPPQVEFTRKEVSQDESPMPATMILNGFFLKYRDNAHRTTQLEASLDDIRCDSDGDSNSDSNSDSSDDSSDDSQQHGKISAESFISFDGGDWSRIDGIQYELSALPVRAPGVSFVHSVKSLVLKGDRLKTNLEIDLEKLGLSKFKNVNIFLRGFRFHADRSRPDGYNIKGISVKLTPTGRKDNIFTVDVTAELKAGEVAFRPGPGYFFNTDADIFFTLVGADEADFSRASSHYMLINRERAPEEVRRVATMLEPGEGHAIAAIQGFEYDIHSTKARYAREFSLSIDNTQFDPASGKASALCTGYFSNEGTWSGALDIRFNADILFMKLPAAQIGPPIKISGELTEVTETYTERISHSFS